MIVKIGCKENSDQLISCLNAGLGVIGQESKKPAITNALIAVAGEGDCEKFLPLVRQYDLQSKMKPEVFSLALVVGRKDCDKVREFLPQILQ